MATGSIDAPAAVTVLMGEPLSGIRRMEDNAALRRKSLPLNNIKDAETHGLARELAATTGETITKAVHLAIRERLQKVRARRTAGRRLADRLDDIARHCAALPVIRDRPAEEILGYDERGLPG